MTPVSFFNDTFVCSARDLRRLCNRVSLIEDRAYDLMMVLSESMTLPEFLKRRIRLLGEEGLMCIAFPEMQARYSNLS